MSGKKQRITPPHILEYRRWDKVLICYWREGVRLRARGRCESDCAGRIRHKKFQCHHVWPKSYALNTTSRWDLDNGAYLGSIPCHVFGRAGWRCAHADIPGFQKFLIEKRGQKWYDTMVIRTRQRIGKRQCDYKLIAMYLKQQILDLRLEVTLEGKDWLLADELCLCKPFWNDG